MDTESTVFVVDDDPAARKSVAALVRAKGVNAESFESGEQFLAQYDPSRGGCLVVDVRMPGMSGIELQEKLSARGAHLPVIVITGYGDVPMAVRAMRGGAVTFLTKPCREQELWENITSALEQERNIRRQAQQREEIKARLAALSEREVQVMVKIIEGKPNKRIASELNIGLRTVELRRATILKKMEVNSLAELVQLATIAEFTVPGSNDGGDETAPPDDYPND